ncbi:TauD/TfdA family dioxygenase [Alphaproteobacteria bacterium]|nr:TauD/TfdA family dioxygenase [Alphaproteobacteria bacterium]
MLSDLTLRDDGLSVAIAGNGTVDFDYFWLRDNARDPISFDSRSHQRELFTCAISADIKPIEAGLLEGGKAIEIKWPDLDDAVRYDGDFLKNFAVPTDPLVMPEPSIWDTKSLDADGVRIAYKRVCGDNGNANLLDIISKFGFAVITDTPRNLDAVEDVTGRIGYVRHTIFGGLFEFEANENMADSAYTPKELRPHTDGTYSHDAPGLQMLLCVDYDATGGASIMVDGFRIAAELQRTEPQIYADLTRIGVTGIYKGDGVVLRARRPILRTDDTGKLLQVSFNNYDRDTVMLPKDDMRALYAGIRAFDKLANDPAFQWRYTLTPGDMLVFDNWRVLHGRGPFEGRRKMAGSYLNREDYESAVRVSGLC